jgi:hypothetical protein
MSTSLTKYVSPTLLLAPLSLLPLVFYPHLADSFELPKWGILIVSLCITLGLFLHGVSRQSAIQLEFSWATVGFFLISIGSILGALFSGNIPEGFVTPTGPVVWTTFFLISLLHPLKSLADQGKIGQFTLILTALATSLIAIVSRLNGFQALTVSFPVLSSKSFTPAGIAITTFMGLVFVLILIATQAISAYKTKQTTHFQLLIGASCLLVIGAIALFTTILPDILNNRLGIQDNWKIMLGASSVPKQAIVGVGPQNYLVAFTNYRPPHLNTTSIWNTRSLSGIGLLFHLQTTIGVLGSLGLGFLLLHIMFQAKGWISHLLSGSLLFTYILVPPNLTLLVIIFLLIYTTTSKSKNIQINVSKYILKGLPAGGVIILIFSLITLYYTFVLFRADHAIYQAQNSLNLKDGQAAYNSVIQATKLFPYSTSYRRSASVVQASIGFSLLNDASPEGSTSAQAQENKTQAARLLSQSIEDAKAATVLGSQNVVNWENLGNIYLQLIGLADNAASWSIASYQKAVSLDPTNPVNRYRLGVAYANGGDIDRGIAQLITAIELRDSYPEPYLVLSQIYASRSEWQKTLNALDITLKLIPDGELKTQVEKDRISVVEKVEQAKTQTNQTQLPVDSPTPTNTPSPTLAPKLPLNLPVAATDSAVPSPELPNKRPLPNPTLSIEE